MMVLVVMLNQDARIVLPILRRMEQPEQIIAMSIIAAVPLSYVIVRGEQVLTWSLIVEEATMRQDMVINNVPDEPKEIGTYKGATVIAPIKGYYPDPVIVLDFKSLYPSCMLAYNICLSTHMGTFKDTDGLRERFPEPEFVVIPIEDSRATVFRCDGPRGVLPIVVQRLLDERAKYKDRMAKSAPGSEERAKNNARQIAAKVRANSAYGFLGAATSPVAAIGAVDLASSITSAGREALQRTRVMIEEMSAAGDIPADARVIYGDTDSVMVHLPGKTAEEAVAIGHKISERVTRSFRRPMELEYEATMLCCLFANKKRYAGWTITGETIMKGISTKRRDFPAFVQHTVQGVLDELLKSTDGLGAERALKVYATAMDSLVQHSVPWEDLILVKELNKTDYKAKTKPPHATVADKMEARQPGRGPKTGDRVAFVVTAVDSSTAGVADKSEDPEYARQQGLSPDYGYYAELVSKQVMELLHVARLDVEGGRIKDRGIKRARALCGGQTTLPWAPLQSLLSNDETPQVVKKPRTEEASRTRQTTLHKFFSRPPLH